MTVLLCAVVGVSVFASQQFRVFSAQTKLQAFNRKLARLNRALEVACDNGQPGSCNEVYQISGDSFIDRPRGDRVDRALQQVSMLQFKSLYMTGQMWQACANAPVNNQPRRTAVKAPAPAKKDPPQQQASKGGGKAQAKASKGGSSENSDDALTAAIDKLPRKR